MNNVNNFVDNDNDIVTNKTTGLMLQKADSGFGAKRPCLAAILKRWNKRR